MSNNIILTIAPFFHDGEISPSLSLASLAAFLRSKKVMNVRCLDLRLGIEENEIYKLHKANLPGKVLDIRDLPLVAMLLSGKKLEKRLIGIVAKKWGLNASRLEADMRHMAEWARAKAPEFSSARLVGLTVFCSNLLYTIALAKELRSRYPAAKIVMGGPQIMLSAVTREILIEHELADHLVIGEGELPLLKIVNGIRGMKKLPVMLAEMPIPDLDALPVPDFSDLDLAQYPPFQLPYFTSRGCVYGCEFCSERKLFPGYRKKTVNKIINDLKQLKDRYRAVRISMMDSILNPTPGRTEELASAILSNKLNIVWGGYLSSKGISRENAKLLKRAGLSFCTLGIESFDATTLKRMKKASSASTNFEAISALVASGIRTNINLIVGYPAQKRDDFDLMCRSMMDWFLSLGGGAQGFYDIRYFFFQYLPASDAYDIAAKEKGRLLPFSSDSMPGAISDLKNIKKCNEAFFWNRSYLLESKKMERIVLAMINKLNKTKRNAFIDVRSLAILSRTFRPDDRVRLNPGKPAGKFLKSVNGKASAVGRSLKKWSEIRRLEAAHGNVRMILALLAYFRILSVAAPGAILKDQ
ncbi:MAG: B12-binding domain-containing radical SAM protein [Candidatus Margulisbacteria bacterium]|nr:B12-binding domain-containing radical SAM protein [Candidatus Margulisiibacteriota bacterium]